MGNGNHHCEGGNTVVSGTLPSPFVFAFKETSDWSEISRRWRGEKQSHYMVACAGGGVLCHWNTKPCTQAKQMPWQNGDYVEK